MRESEGAGPSRSGIALVTGRTMISRANPLPSPPPEHRGREKERRAGDTLGRLHASYARDTIARDVLQVD